MDNINIIGSGGTGDLILGIRLRYLLNYIYPNLQVSNFLCSRAEVWKMIESLYPQDIKDGKIKQLPESYLDNINNGTLNGEEEFKNLYGNTYIVYPDKLFRGKYAPPLKEFGITNFGVKQTRTLLGKWKPENYISLALNSITAGYTYHSIKELALKLAAEFPNKLIYLPLLSRWNNKDLSNPEFNGNPENLIVDYDPEFSKVYDILCKSEYCICTDNAIMHICHDLGMPYLTLDPQWCNLLFESRWRPYGFYHSVPIGSLTVDIIDIIKTQINIPETQMIPANKVYRNKVDWSKELLFKE